MGEQRLIDANALREDWLENGENEYVYDTNSFLYSVDDAPTIDPETLPIVRQLRAELEKVKLERDAIAEDLKVCAMDNYVECIYCKNGHEKFVSEICRNCEDGSYWEYEYEQED